MFNQLLKLYKRRPEKTPIEDFTTEVLAGLLNADQELKRKFCKDFLEMESRFFKVTSQKRYNRNGIPLSIVDIVVEGEKEVCFIENKVNSPEGTGQLPKYCKVLDQLASDGLATRLVYCTKNQETKQIEGHAFKAVKWQDVAHFIQKHSSEKLSFLFVEYLKANGMANDMTVKSEDLVALENFGRVFNIMNEHLERLKPDFKRRFRKLKDARQGKSFVNQCRLHNRFCIYSEGVVEGKGWSEVLYGFEFAGNIVTQIFVGLENEYYKSFREAIERLRSMDGLSSMQVEHFDGHGSRVYLSQNLGVYLNDESSEEKIENWFRNSFTSIDKFMVETKETINWSLKRFPDTDFELIN